MTGKIFLKLIAGVFCLLLLALVTVDYFATSVAKDNYIQNLTGQLAEKGRMLALTFAAPETLDGRQARLLARAAGGRVTGAGAHCKGLVESVGARGGAGGGGGGRAGGRGGVGGDGKVGVDGEAEAAGMENHRSRPELVK